MPAKRKARRKAPAAPAACDDQAAAEARQFARTLRANRQVASGQGPLPPGATHVEEKDEKGRTRLKRKRFSAV
jgi:hypothetical protein